MFSTNVNFGSSVLKREAKPMDEVANQLKRNGWEETGSIGSRARQFENSGLSVTVVDGPMATLVIPSGPIRGKVFGSSGLEANQTSVIGAGAGSSDSSNGQEEKIQKRTDQLV